VVEKNLVLETSCRLVSDVSRTVLSFHVIIITDQPHTTDLCEIFFVTTEIKLYCDLVHLGCNWTTVPIFSCVSETSNELDIQVL